MAYQYTRIVRFQDTDAAGVVYFANLLSICHESYEASLAEVGINLKLFFSNSSALAVPIVHANINFFKPLFCGDSLRVKLTPKLLNENSFEIDYQVFGSETTEKSAAVAITRHVCIETKTRQRHILPAELQQWLCRWRDS
ncbi:acyl-CoA thioesterase [Ancylothrix sp. C2]|uniref:acyl-CoA thioesterase n=1 Tax=Ancylothrix sp. D3o TaxID=2953691 RepID=UPI0021BA415B|nr:acyl-CoA thioesterase [Ancylothrix sp. D3o]MCT7948771.1 acyl-CoA thioesterase [Ancylothrix sp. D3o]